jgi:hypothetical protein
MKKLLILLVVLSTTCTMVIADTGKAPLKTSPKQPWGESVFDNEKKTDPWWVHVLLWLPNRVMDLVDVVKMDVGAGPAVGGVVRVTRYGQLGYRDVDPISVRFGAMGRRSPVLVERTPEKGIGPGFVSSKERKVCPGEIGVGLDAFVVGGYAGICVDELLDFAAGLFFLDPAQDDTL